MNYLRKILLLALSFAIAINVAACSSNTKKTEEESSVTTLFDDSSCWTICIDEVDYTFPMKYDEFVSHGWKVYNLTLDDTLYPKQTNSSFSAIYNETDTKFRLVFGNFDTAKIDYTEGYVVGIGLSFTVSEKTNAAFPEIILPKNIVFNEQPSVEDIEAAYGTANDKGSNQLKYWYESNVLTRALTLDYFGTEEMQGFDLINYANPEKSN